MFIFITYLLISFEDYMRFLKQSKYLFSETVKLSHNPNNSSVITLSNIPKRNTLSSETMNKINDALMKTKERIQRKQTKIVILNSQGPVFSSGHDLKQLSSSAHPEKIFELCCEMMLNLRNLSVPTLCSINGVAAAAGLQLALTCDIVIATPNSTFSTPGVKWGLFCSTPAVQLIRTINSEKKAMEMLLFGESITAQEAYHYGLVNKVVAEIEMNKQIDNYINKVNKLSGQVISLGKRVYRQQSKQEIKDAYCTAVLGMKENIEKKQDCKEGLKAFSQKRHPHYKN